MKYALFALAALAGTPALAGQTCTINTFVDGNIYLTTVEGESGSPVMTRAEAEALATQMNEAHNIGVNPVEARLYCN